ncbi:MAG: tetratricopeptide repeat protein, partial [Myxococcota bacterium]
HFEIAELLKGALSRRLDAVGSYRTILDLDPTNLEAVRGLKAIFQQEENWAEMAQVVEQELGLLQNAGEVVEARGLTLQLGNLYEHQLHNAEQAVHWYARLLGEPSESRAPAVSALEGLLRLEQDQEPERAVRIAALLEPVHREDANHERLAEMLEIRLSAMDDPEQTQATLWELARLYEQEIGDPGAAFGALRRLLAIVPSERKVWDELERLAGVAEAGRWAEVAELFGAITPSRDNLDAEPWAFELLRRLARVFEQELSDDHQAREAYETLLLRDSSDMLTITSLEEVYSRLEAWPELVELLERKALLVDTAEARKTVLFRVAAIHESDAAFQPDEAIGTYRRILVDDPRDVEATDRLEGLLAREGRWRDLVDQLSARMELAEDEAARLPIMFQLGRVFEQELDDRAGAIDTYRQILAVDPGHADALGAMERLSAELHEEEGDLELRRIIDDTLEPIYTQAEAWERLVHVLGLKLGYAELESEQATLHIRIGRLHRDKLDQADVAFNHLRQAVTLRFDDAELRSEFEALADTTGRHADVVLLYEDLLATGSGVHDGLRLAVLERLAGLQEQQLANVPAAIDAWVRLMEIDPAAPNVLNNLERLYEAEGQWSELVDICQRKAQMAEGAEQVA